MWQQKKPASWLMSSSLPICSGICLDPATVLTMGIQLIVWLVCPSLWALRALKPIHPPILKMGPVLWRCGYEEWSVLVGRKEPQKQNKNNNGDAGYRSPYLSHAKRALYHLSYIPCWPFVLLLPILFKSTSGYGNLFVQENLLSQWKLWNPIWWFISITCQKGFTAKRFSWRDFSSNINISKPKTLEQCLIHEKKIWK